MQTNSQLNTDDLREAWVHFSAAENHEEYCQRWLELMCARIDGIEIGTLLLESGEAGFQPRAIWPEKSEPDYEFSALI